MSGFLHLARFRDDGTVLMTDRIRAIAAAILLAVTVILVPVSASAWWVRDTVTSTEGYVNTVAPLATDPEVVAAMERRLTDRVMLLLDNQHILIRASEALKTEGVPAVLADSLGLLAEPLRDRAEKLVTRVVHRLLTDPAFAEAWIAANEVAHDELIAVLSGDTDVVLVSGDSTVSIRIVTLTNSIKLALVDAGLPFAERIPTVEASFPIAQVDDLTKAQRAYDVLDRVGHWLPWLTIGLFALGVGLARKRRRAVLAVSAAAIASLVLLILGIAAGRHFLVGHLPPTASQPAASAAYDILVAQLRHLIRGVGVVILLMAAVAFFAGSSAGATSARARVASTWRDARAVIVGWPWSRPAAGGLALVCVGLLVATDGLGLLATVMVTLVAGLSAAIAVLAAPSP